MIYHFLCCNLNARRSSQSQHISVCRTEQEAAARALGRQVRFLANVDPVDVARALNGFDQEETLVVVVSKTFTTAETMLNARTVRYKSYAYQATIVITFKGSAAPKCFAME